MCVWTHILLLIRQILYLLGNLLGPQMAISKVKHPNTIQRYTHVIYMHSMNIYMYVCICWGVMVGKYWSFFPIIRPLCDYKSRTPGVRDKYTVIPGIVTSDLNRGILGSVHWHCVAWGHAQCKLPMFCTHNQGCRESWMILYELLLREILWLHYGLVLHSFLAVLVSEHIYCCWLLWMPHTLSYKTLCVIMSTV